MVHHLLEINKLYIIETLNGCVKYAYTFSSRGNMPKDLLKSVKSLLSFADPQDIVVFYTPPRDESHLDTLEALGIDVRLREHYGDAFKMGREDEPSHYNDKLWICEMDDEEVAFLDCDTVVLEDPSGVFDGDFDFKAREDEYDLEATGWSVLFEKFDKRENWMPNAGFMIFKNGILKQSKEELRRFVEYDYDELDVDTWHLEQYAFSLAMSEYSISRMDKTDHAFGWLDETPPSATVYHIGGRRVVTPKEAVANNLRFKFRKLLGRENIGVF